MYIFCLSRKTELFVDSSRYSLTRTEDLGKIFRLSHSKTYPQCRIIPYRDLSGIALDAITHIHMGQNDVVEGGTWHDPGAINHQMRNNFKLTGDARSPLRQGMIPLDTPCRSGGLAPPSVLPIPFSQCLKTGGSQATRETS